MDLAAVLVSSAISLAQLGILALSLSLIYGVLRLPNFAQGELFVAGGYIATFLLQRLALPLWASVLLAVLGTGLLSILIDRSVFRHLRQAPVLTLMIVSFGLSIVLQNTFLGLAGPNQVNLTTAVPTVYTWGSVRVTQTQLVIMAVAVAAVVAMHLLLYKTAYGRAVRAVAADPSLARARAIHAERAIAVTWFFSGCLAGLAGVLFELEVGLWPYSGSEILLATFAAVMLGGAGTFYRVLAAAAVLALAENLLLAIDFSAPLVWLGLTTSTGLFMPTGYKPAVMFVALVLALYLKGRPLNLRTLWTRRA